MAESTLENKLSDLRADYDALRKDLAEVTKALRDTANARAGATAKRAADAADAATERVRTTATEAVGSLENEIRERPWVALGAAFGIGLLIGRLLRS